mmetsp:Transcript_25703/g.56663  ORF Transcript_25703/g.56663 Transcript_25703/m.56663 type:complete len:225 (+) Transcript_25703:113-787(+)
MEQPPSLVTSPKQSPTQSGLPGPDALGSRWHLRLLQRDTEALHRPAQSGGPALLLVVSHHIFGNLLSSLLLHLFLALHGLTPRHQHQVPAVQGRHDILPLSDLLNALVVVRLGASQHVLLDSVQQSRDLCVQLTERDVLRGTSVSSDHSRCALLQILRTHLNPQGHPLQLPVVVLPPRGVVVPVIHLTAKPLVLESREDLVTLVHHVVQGLILERQRNQHHLGG